MAASAPKPAPPRLTVSSAGSPLPDSVLAAISSPNTRRSYAKAFAALEAFAAGRTLSRKLLLDWRRSMSEAGAGLSSSTINVRLSAVKKLVREAWRRRLIDGDTAAELLDVAGVPRRGTRIGNWLTVAQSHTLLAVPASSSARASRPRSSKTPNLRGDRNLCVLALLLGCALRRCELSALNVEHLQVREGRWVLADIEGKGGRVRTVAVPPWVKQAIDAWFAAARRAGSPITTGRIVRRLTLSPEGLDEDSIWQIVRAAALKIGVPNFGPHDLRRTCAKLARNAGGKLEDIQALLGHESIGTTQRYLGSEQDLRHAVNDSLGL